MIWEKKDRLILASLLLATTLVYTNSLNNPFTSDDRHIIFINFQPWTSWTVGDLFRRSLFATEPSESSYFRPLTLVTFALNFALAGERPEGYRAVNIAVHLSVLVLIFALFSRLAEGWIATFATLLFALHPVHVQAITYISSRSDLLYTALALLCLLLWYQGSQAKGIRKQLCLSCALSLFFLGLFAKETMVMVVPLVALMDFIWHRTGSWRDQVRHNLPWYGGLLALFAIYLVVRTGLSYPLLMERGLEISFGSRVLIAFKLFGLYLGLAFYPNHLSLFHTMEVPQNFFEWQVILGVVLLAGMLVLAALTRELHKEISFGILWYLVSLLPILNLTLLNAPMMEHWLYLPLIGLTVAFVGAVRSLAVRVGEIRGAALGLILLALLLSAKTATRNAEWSDLFKMALHDVSSYPRSAGAWSLLGSTLKGQGRLAEAVDAYRTSLDLSPSRPENWIGLGEALSFLGKEDEAEAALSRAVSIQPKNSAFHYILGMHRLKVGRNRAAIDALKRSIELHTEPLAYHALGSAYLRLRENQKAEEAFHKALAIYPGNQSFHAEVHTHHGKLYQLQGRMGEAWEEWQLALRFDPNNVEARGLLQKGTENSPAGEP